MTEDDEAADGRLLDLRGLRCPLPVLKLRKALRETRSGVLITALCDDPLSAVDVPNFLRESGDELLEATPRDGAVAFRVRRAAGDGPDACRRVNEED